MLGGSIAGVERDDEGNIIGFSPEKFALGFATGAGSAKALSKIANTKSAQNLANQTNKANQNLAQNLASTKGISLSQKSIQKLATNPRAKAILEKMQVKSSANNDKMPSQKLATISPEKKATKDNNQMAEKQSKSNFEVTKKLEKQYRNAIVIPKQEVMKGLGLDGRVVGDFVKLAQKHPEYFAHPQEAQKLCQEVLKNAEIGINATDRRFKLIIAKVKNGKRDYGSVAIRVQNINGEHRIRSVLFMDSEQIRVKVAKAKELGEPILQF